MPRKPRKSYKLVNPSQEPNVTFIQSFKTFTFDNLQITRLQAKSKYAIGKKRLLENSQLMLSEI